MASVIEQSIKEYMDYLDGKDVDVEVMKATIPVKSEFDGQAIKSLRKNINVTQRGLANLLGVSTRTVESWETNRTTPRGSSQKLLGLLQKDTGLAKDLLYI